MAIFVSLAMSLYVCWLQDPKNLSQKANSRCQKDGSCGLTYMDIQVKTHEHSWNGVL